MVPGQLHRRNSGHRTGGDRPRYQLASGQLNEATGVLAGVPDAIGNVEVTVTATINREVRKLDEKALIWGNEKVLSTAVERVGAATQRFVIDVR